MTVTIDNLNLSGRFGVAINNNGQVTGWSGSSVDGGYVFVWSQGTATSLALPAGDVFATTTALNDTGIVVGDVQIDVPAYWQNGSVVTLTPYQGYTAGDTTAVNDSGEIAGFLLNGFLPSATVWINGSPTILSSDISTATAINASGEVGGWDQLGHDTAAIWLNGKETVLGLLPGDLFSSVRAINNAGVVVGASDNLTTISHAFIWTGGTMTQLPGLSSSGWTQAAAINNQGIVAGTSSAADGTAHAVIWVNDALIDLNSYLPANSGWVLSSATGINDHDQIVGTGTYNGTQTAFYLDLGGTPVSTLTASQAAALATSGQLVVATTIADQAAAVAANLDALQTLMASGKVTSITLTDSGIPNLTVTAAQLSNDASVLNDISTSHTVTVQFTGNASQYTVTTANGSVSVNGQALPNVAALQFADQTDIVAQTPGSGTVTTGNVTELYSAVLAREPDVAGLAYYQNYLKGNPSTPLLQFAEWFLSSSEYTSNSAHNYAQTTAGDAQFIADSYQNLLHRTPSASEVTFYQNNVMAPALAGLTAGTQAYAAAEFQAHAQMLVYFSASAEFLADVQITAQNPSSAQHWLILT